MAHSDEPLLIAVLGGTGAGKTTFISKATGKTNMKIGHGMESCTQKMEMADMIIDGQRVVLIDTPGFDDTYKSDADILELLAKHLHVTYEAGKLLNGVILLQPININRVTGNEKKRTRLFESICGPDAYKNVVIASTFWGEIGNKATGVAREKERIQNDDFWGKMVAQGTRVTRHENTAQSAIRIVSMLRNTPKVVLQMQEELSSNGGRISYTAAGKELDKDLGEKYAKLQQELAETKKSMADEIQELKAKLELLEEQRDLLATSRIQWPEKTIQNVKHAFDNFTEWCKEDGADALACGAAGATAAGMIALEVAYLAPLALACTIM